MFLCFLADRVPPVGFDWIQGRSGMRENNFSDSLSGLGRSGMRWQGSSVRWDACICIYFLVFIIEEDIR